MVRLGDNQMYVASSGDGNPVILVHGFASSVWTSWHLNFHALAERFHVFGIDLMGFGRSDRPELQYGVELFAEIIRSIVDYYNLKKPNLVGWSMGGGVAIQYALRYPDNLAKLVLVDASRLRQTTPAEMRRSTVKSSPDGSLIRDRVRKDWEQYFYNKDKVPEEIIDEALLINNRPGSSMVRNIYRMANKWESFYDKLSLIQAPVLVMVATHSSLSLDDARSAQQRMKHSELHVINDAGHALQIEKAEEFNRAVIDFLR